MASHDALYKRLEKLQHNMDKEELEEICDKIEAMEDGAQFVPALLAILEENPDFDFGTPGFVVSTLEKFDKVGYEDSLIESLNRKPTTHLVWMLNRLINGSVNSGEIEKAEKYINFMVEISMSSKVDTDVRDAAKFFLE